MTKHLEQGCTGSVLCELPGHVKNKQYKSGETKFSHKPLTVNQRKELVARIRKGVQVDHPNYDLHNFKAAHHGPDSWCVECGLPADSSCHAVI